MDALESDAVGLYRVVDVVADHNAVDNHILPHFFHQLIFQVCDFLVKAFEVVHLAVQIGNLLLEGLVLDGQPGRLVE